MNQSFLFGLSALVALAPAALVGLRSGGRDAAYWAAVAVAAAGPLAWTAAQMAGRWETGVSASLWVTVSTVMVLFVLLAAATQQAWRLTPLIVPYLVLLGAMALIWQQAPARPLTAALDAWVEIHIASAVLTYALVTIAAVAALAALLQERALKAKRPTQFTDKLPSVADSESLLVRLLIASEVILGVGLATGMATLYRETGRVLAFDHKIVLTVTAFGVIGGLLAAHFISGTRGRSAGRWVLLAYLLLTLGYPGVKFVTDVLMS
jgi:ABC-type uncharacterized transport system permease subunit